MPASESRLLEQLGPSLESAFCCAVRQARLKHSDEHFYAYILYTSPLLEYAAASFATEESLARLAEDVKERHELRWSPPDWEYNWAGEEFFAEVKDVLGQLFKIQGYDEPARSKRWDVFMLALHRLDADGIFGTGAARESALVNIMWGDQDCVAHVESARELNPFVSYLSFAKYQFPFLRASEKEIEGGRSMYKEEALVRIRRAIARVEEDLRGGVSARK